MTERVLNILKRQGKNISCIFTGKLIETLSEDQLTHILDQIKEIGSIRKSIAIFDHQLKPEAYGTYIKQGISPVIVPSDEDIHMALEGMDVVLTQQTDILCLGVVDEVLLPMISSARESTEILLIAPTKQTIENSLIYADYLILAEDLLK
ncbi:MAG: hypothetical protein GOP50_02240 [Candidatus Heimdallarchaeota archaeon]|nr:hypothetical protein [Candidatus Heimdallarchaeota archaeon]